jgi:hypothetical protein
MWRFSTTTQINALKERVNKQEETPTKHNAV